MRKDKAEKREKIKIIALLPLFSPHSTQHHWASPSLIFSQSNTHTDPFFSSIHRFVSLDLMPSIPFFLLYSQKSEKTPFLRSPAISKAKKHLKETLFQCYASSPKGGQGLGKHLSEVTSSTRSTSTDSNSQTRLSPMTARRLSPQVADL